MLWERGDTGRVSVASLASWDMDGTVEVAKELVDERHPAMYRESTLREYLSFVLGGKALDTGTSFMESIKIN